MTRLYLPNTGTPAIAPTPHAEWDDVTTVVKALAVVTRINSVLANTGPFNTGAVNTDILVGQFLYALPTGIAFTTSHVIWGQIRCAESNNGANLRSQCIIRVLDSAGTTVRATLYAGDLTTLSGNPPSEWSTFTENRQVPRGTNVPVAVNYTSVAGDWLCIEVGGRRHSATTSYSARMQLGDNGATDLPLDESTQNNLNPWIEFTTDLTAAPTRRRQLIIS
jgi:hypothetical protein